METPVICIAAATDHRQHFPPQVYRSVLFASRRCRRIFPKHFSFDSIYDLPTRHVPNLTQLYLFKVLSTAGSCDRHSTINLFGQNKRVFSQLLPDAHVSSFSLAASSRYLNGIYVGSYATCTWRGKAKETFRRNWSQSCCTNWQRNTASHMNRSPP